MVRRGNLEKWGDSRNEADSGLEWWPGNPNPSQLPAQPLHLPASGASHHPAPSLWAPAAACRKVLEGDRSHEKGAHPLGKLRLLSGSSRNSQCGSTRTPVSEQSPQPPTTLPAL